MSKRLSSYIFILMLVFCFIMIVNIKPIQAAGSVETITYLTPPDGAQYIGNYSPLGFFDFWRYSGGVWRAGTASGEITISSSQVAWNEVSVGTLLPSGLLNFSLPSQVQTALDEGDDVAIVLNSSMNQYIRMDPYIDRDNMPYFLRESNGTYTFFARPKFNVLDPYENPKFTFSNFLPHLYSYYIPLMDYGDGHNLYDIVDVSGGGSIGSARGFFNRYNPESIAGEPFGHIHPSQIAGSTGTFVEPPFQINLFNSSSGLPAGAEAMSDTLKINSGFATGSAVGARFNIQYNFSFYRVQNADIAVVDIQPREFYAGVSNDVYVTIKNLTDKAVTTFFPLQFGAYRGVPPESVWPFASRTFIELTLGPNEQKVLQTWFNAPDDGTRWITLRAEANPLDFFGRRYFREADYTNNRMEVSAEIIEPILMAETVGCDSVLNWNETRTHLRDIGGGVTELCNHRISWQSELSEVHVLDPKELKSGYGITVDMTCTITEPHIILNYGCGSWSPSAPLEAPIPPQRVTVEMPMEDTVRLSRPGVGTRTQPKIVLLEKKSETRLESLFVCAENDTSELYYISGREDESRKIYVNVRTPGTKDRPVDHEIPILISGGGIAARGVSWCLTVMEEITINGDMYEDHYTTAVRPE